MSPIIGLSATLGSTAVSTPVVATPVTPTDIQAIIEAGQIIAAPTLPDTIRYSFSISVATTAGQATVAALNDGITLTAGNQVNGVARATATRTASGSFASVSSAANNSKIYFKNVALASEIDGLDHDTYNYALAPDDEGSTIVINSAEADFDLATDFASDISVGTGQIFAIYGGTIELQSLDGNDPTVGGTLYNVTNSASFSTTTVIVIES